MTRTTALAAVLLSTWAVAACETEPEFGRTDSTSAAQMDITRTDAQLSTAVQAKYYTDEVVRGRRIDVAADDGVVTLRGTVEDENARERAVALARDVEGVREVNDELTVQPEETADAAADAQRDRTDPATLDRIADATEPMFITTTIQAKYFLADSVKPSRIDVTTATDGVVTLEGTVDSEAARAEAIRLAQETDGVARVEDRLRIEPGLDEMKTGYTAEAPEGQSPDAWVTMKIQAKYFVDGDVHARNIDVDTQDGMVTLTGMVGSEAERRQAVALARNTDGVREVTDRLTVDSTMDSDREQADAPAAADVERPDPWITTKIQAKYFLDPDVKGHEINVDTVDGVVTLAGTVENAEQKLEAEQIARETEGVSRVVNELRVDAVS